MGVLAVFGLYVLAVAVLLIPSVLTGVTVGTLLSRGRFRKLRKRFQIAGAMLPVLAAGYFLCCVVAMAAFGLLTHRDFGFGDGFEIPLNNTYQFSAIDLPNIATLYRRGKSVVADSSSQQIQSSGAPVIENVFALQQRGDWLYGARGTSNPRFADDKRVPDRWFLLNTRTLTLREVDSDAKFSAMLGSERLNPSLIDSEDFYGRERYRWYDAVAILLLALPPCVTALLLFKAVRKIRGACCALDWDGRVPERQT